MRVESISEKKCLVQPCFIASSEIHVLEKAFFFFGKMSDGQIKFKLNVGFYIHHKLIH